MALTVAEAAGVLNIDFDAEEDVLYINLGQPVASYADEGPRGLLFRWANTDNHPTGVTAVDFQSNWPGPREELYSAVATHLRLPMQLVHHEITRALHNSILCV